MATKNWDELIAFKPSRRLQGNLTIRTGGRIQFLEDGVGKMSQDLYPVRIHKLPPKFESPEDLLSRIRKEINKFIDTDLTRFSPYDINSTEEKRNASSWKSDKPLETILDIMIDLPGLPFFDFTSEKATVIVSKFNPKRWFFSTVYTRDNGYHPVCGTREFGVIARASGGATVYTKAVDRVSGVLEQISNEAADAVVDGQDELWKSFQKKVAGFVNRHGGSATVVDRTLRSKPFPG